MSQSRQLAAIMFTDIVGYTAMMQTDEKKVVAVVKHYNTTLEKLVTQYNGQVLNYYGDGSLCIFSSATDAVNCSLEVQKELRTDPVVPLRIGLHIGEVFFEDAKALGDGVNVASRVQSLGHENTILISEEIQNKIKNNDSIATTSLGHFDFKNVGKSMEVFALTNEGLFVPQRKKMEGKLKNKNVQKRNMITALSFILLIAAAFFIYKTLITGKTTAGPRDKSIAVLPFIDMSPDKDQEYFSDGLSEELINALAKISGLKVAGRTSSFSYKGINKNLKTIGDELGVSTILEGSLRKSGNLLRITAQLINTEDGFHLWTETFDIELTDIFGVQDKITKAIITALNVHLLHDKEWAPTAATNPKAYSSYLRARQKLSLRGIENLLEAKKLFEEAIKYDPDFAPAHSGLGRTLSIIPNFSIDFNAKELMSSAKQEARKALELNSNNAEALSVLGTIAAYYDWDWDAADEAFNKSLAISPNDAEMYNFIGDYYQIVLNKKLAIEMESKAVELDPLLGINYGNLAMAYYIFKDYDNVIKTANDFLSLDLQGFTSIGIIASLTWTYIKLNQFEKADEILKKLTENDPLIVEIKTSIAVAKGDSNLAISNLRKMTNHASSRLAELYLDLGMWDKAAESIEKAYASRDVTLVFYSRIKLPEDYPDHPALRKAFDKPELNKLFEIRRKNLKSQ